MPIPVLPTTGRFHLLANFVAISGIVQSPNQLPLSCAEVARMDKGRDAKPVVDIRIDVGGDLLAFGSRGLYLGDGQLHLAPVLLPGGLQVEDVNRRLARATNVQCFVDRFQQQIAFVAHVRVVATTVLPGNFR